MRLLVTGGAGFIGSRLTERLDERRDSTVLVLDNLSRGTKDNLKKCGESVTLVTGNIEDRRTVEDAMDGVEVVYHLAAQSDVLGATEDVAGSCSSNVVGTYEVLRAARKLGVRRVVFTSSREVYGEVPQLPVTESAPVAPKNAYGFSKAAGEMMCHAFASSGPEIFVLRLANVYGRRDAGRVIPRFIERALRGAPLTIYGGSQTLDFVWVDTVVDALIAASVVDKPEGPVNVGSGQATTLLQLARRVLAETGSASTLELLPARPFDTQAFVASTERMRKVLGVFPDADSLGRLAELVTWSGKR